VFTGWFSAESGGTLCTWPHTLNADITIHARWRAEGEAPPTQYTLTFDSHGGSGVEAVTASEGAAVPKPADPTRTGYAFLGWYSAESGGTLYSWPHTLNAGLTMHAHWRADEEPPPARHTLTFDSHGGSPVEAVTADEGTPVSKPADPARSGHTFRGWYSAESGGTLYSWPHTLNAGLTMHAQWQADAEPPLPQYTLTFDSHGGSAVAAVTADEGAAVPKPADPTRPGYTFQGWFDAESGGAASTWPHTLSVNVTMHAQWTVENYTITYHLNGGTNGANPAAYTVESAAITLAAPTRADYTFRGWYDNQDLTGTAVTTIPAHSTGNKTFWAKWTVSTTAQGVTLTVNDFVDPAEVSGAVPVLSKSGAEGKPQSVEVSVGGLDNGTNALWYVGLTPIRTGDSVTLYADNLSLGTHTLRVTAVYGGVRYSKEITFTVED
jgi:uncharacterized repeat protein (TIGR02543 family)